MKTFVLFYPIETNAPPLTKKYIKTREVAQLTSRHPCFAEEIGINPSPLLLFQKLLL